MANIELLEARLRLIATQQELAQLKLQVLQGQQQTLAAERTALEGEYRQALDNRIEAEVAALPLEDLPQIVSKQLMRDGAIVRDLAGEPVLVRQDGTPLSPYEKAVLKRLGAK